MLSLIDLTGSESIGKLGNSHLFELSRRFIRTLSPSKINTQDLTIILIGIFKKSK
jgi:hypothetical protein